MKVPVLISLCLACVFLMVDSAGIGITTTEASFTNTPLCQAKLSFQIEQCLQKFEAKFLVYNDEDSSKQLQDAMENMLCREYESSLQCLHFALQACPPADFHLEMMGDRLGHVRLLMQNVCQRAHQSTTSQTTTSTTASTTRQLTLQDYQVEDWSQTSGDADFESKIESDYIFTKYAKREYKDLNKSYKNENEVLKAEMDIKDIAINWNAASKTLEMKAEPKGCLEERDPLCNLNNSAKIQLFSLNIIFGSFICLQTLINISIRSV